MSLAKIIAFCLDNVLDEFLQVPDGMGEDDYTDNYRYSGYTFSVYRVYGVVCCKFFWGPDPKIIKKAKQPGHI